MAKTDGYRMRRPMAAGLAPLLALLLALGAIATPSRAAPPAAQATPVASPVASGSVAFAGLLGRTGPLSVADLQAMLAETVEVTSETRDGAKPHSSTGTRRYPLLEALEPVVGADERNPWPTRSVVVTASDGSRVLLSGGELDSDVGDAPILLAWDQGGRSLTGEDGPVRLVTPGDTRGGRYVDGVVRVEVLALEAPASRATRPEQSPSVGRCVDRPDTRDPAAKAGSRAGRGSRGASPTPRGGR